MPQSRQRLLTGGSRAIPAIPFTAGGGILVAVSIAVIPMTDAGPDFSSSPQARSVFDVGSASFALLLPVIDHRAAYLIAILADTLADGTAYQSRQTLRHAPGHPPASDSGIAMNIVAVTACPTGVAHTYMAAENLEKVGEQLGYKIKVETQGAMGIDNEITAVEIATADAVIFAVDIEVKQRERFAGKKIVQVPVKQAIKDPRVIFAAIA